MADIVQLVENGQKKYIKTHVQAVEGLDTMMSNVLIQSGEKIKDYNSTTDSTIQKGGVRFVRYGDFVLVTINLQCRTTNLASGGNVVGTIDSEFIPSQSIHIATIESKVLTIEPSGKITALWGLNANNWYLGTAVYFAKNK